MPSPFPGMDPYLEGGLWMSCHAQLTAELARQLAPRLRPKYLALATERFVIETSGPETGAFLYPDVAVARRSGIAEAAAAGPMPPTPIRMLGAMPIAVPHVSVEIRDAAERRLVTVIELLSLTNKRGEGRAEYLARRQRLLLGTAHLIEIDLLRSGQRVPMGEPLPDAPYFVVLSRVERRPEVEVWPIARAERLPVVPVPLLPGDDDVPLDLQAALDTVYDAVGLDLAVDYGRSPDVPLAGDAAAWAEQVLALRS